MNVLLKNIAEFCREHILEEKWLLAPSLRAGGQWMDGVARGGQPLLNLRVKTFKSIVLELAAPELAASGLKLLSPSAGEILADRAWSRVATGKSKLKYLAALQPGRSLPRVLFDSLNALRLAGLGPGDLRPRTFEVSEKAGDLSRLLDAYIDILRSERRTDYAQATKFALERLQKEPASLAPGVVLLIPNDLGHALRPAENELLDAIPENRRVELSVDEPATPEPGGRTSDATLLRWLPALSRAPKPANDGTLKIFRAAGEVNEVREVLRRCVCGGLKLDAVELLHTDNDAYIPLLYEQAERLGRWGETSESMLPVTFAEGIPCRYFRPGRALAAWLSWIAEDYPQKTLVRMIQDGLLNIDSFNESEFSMLADLLRPVEIGQGADRYKKVFAQHVAKLERQLESGTLAAAGEDGTANEGRTPALATTKKLRDFIVRLLAASPAPEAPDSVMLEAAETFLSTHARCVTELDNNARNALCDQVRELRGLLSPGDLFSGFRVHAWLGALPGTLRVGGSGPRPGCLHAAHYLNGGHSGRAHTFIIGLDDGRFPGAGLQDPLLLDSERRRLSPDKLEVAGARLEARTHAFQHLVARLRGSVTLGFSSRDLSDERETFPSSAVLDTYRLLSANLSADQRDLDAALALPASFAPADDALSLDESEWWLWRMHDAERVADPRGLVARNFPHLGRGLLAAQQRASARAGEYDGIVVEAGRDLNPLAPDGPVMSASRLETLGKCPLQYFFKHVLQIESPDEIELDPRRWLDAYTSGQLLHDVFRDYVLCALNANEKPEQDEAELMNLLDRTIKKYVQDYPSPSETVFQKECRDLQAAMRIFLHAGNLFDDDVSPLFVEATVGMPSAEPGTPLDTAEPVAISLPDKNKVRVCGRIDRVDRVGPPDQNCFAIVDYKTGRAQKFSRGEPFVEGRVVQHLLYLEMARAVLQKQFPGATLARFSFFFAGVAGNGDSMLFGPAQLAGGQGILQNLCHVAAGGAFLPTTNSDDCKICSYRAVCRDTDAVTKASVRKLQSDPNAALQPFRELRGEGGADDPAAT